MNWKALFCVAIAGLTANANLAICNCEQNGAPANSSSNDCPCEMAPDQTNQTTGRPKLSPEQPEKSLSNTIHRSKRSSLNEASKESALRNISALVGIKKLTLCGPSRRPFLFYNWISTKQYQKKVTIKVEKIPNGYPENGIFHPMISWGINSIIMW